jgi:hypothetical protein
MYFCRWLLTLWRNPLSPSPRYDKCWWICTKLKRHNPGDFHLDNYCHNCKSHKAAEIVSCVLTTAGSGLVTFVTNSFRETPSFCIWWLRTQKIQCFQEAQEVFIMATNISQLTHSFQIFLYALQSPPPNNTLYLTLRDVRELQIWKQFFFTTACVLLT